MARREWIPTEALPALQIRIEGLTRRAERLGVDPPRLKELRTDSERTLVELAGEPPRLRGWRVVAELLHEPTGTRVEPMPGEGLPRGDWSQAEPRCDHCGLRRQRKTTLLLVHRSGDIAQVGTGCLENFTGSRDPLARVALERAVADARGVPAPAAPAEPTVASFLAAVAAAAREHGFVAKADAKEGETPTAEAGATAEAEGLVTDEDRELAVAIERWVLHELAGREGLRPYEQRLVSVFTRSERVGKRDRAMVASAWRAYQEDRERAARREHLGDVGEAIDVVVRVEDVRRTERGSRYGEVWWHELRDGVGHRLAWFAVGRKLKVAGRYRLHGRVRRHDEFRGRAVTVLEQCRVAGRVADEGP